MTKVNQEPGGDVEELFDGSIEEASDLQLSRMEAQAADALASRTQGSFHPVLFGVLAGVLAAAALFTLGYIQDKQDLFAPSEFDKRASTPRTPAVDLDLAYESTFDMGWGVGDDDGGAILDLADGPFGDLNDREIQALYDELLNPNQDG